MSIETSYKKIHWAIKLLIKAVFIIAALMIIAAIVIRFIYSNRTISFQGIDDSFTFDNPSPVYAFNNGPLICIGKAHNEVDYSPFIKMLRGDGYKVEDFEHKLTGTGLKQCELLVIVNPIADENMDDWSYPHHSAFSKNELRELQMWIRSGGRLLLIADHAPLAAASRDLGAVLGIIMIDVHAGVTNPDQFHLSNQTLIPHPILNGRSQSESVDKVFTFDGQVVQLTQGWQPLLVFGPGALAKINLSQTFQQGPAEEWPSFSVDGWAQGAARSWDEGRIVFLGEAAMCSAQFGGESQFPFGMNDPLANQNAQFCLNTVHWLTGVLDDL